MDQIPLSDAKARFSEVVRMVRRRGEGVVVTVDGRPAVRIVPVSEDPKPLTSAELAAERVILDAIRTQALPGEFDAVALVGQGRR